MLKLHFYRKPKWEEGGRGNGDDGNSGGGGGCGPGLAAQVPIAV